ncbi:hypothetical protein SNE40_015664 [Patella caerulea]|uniref:Endoglucanase n=1 Tax=Patella caerulea TaxID=87958 RepID=A0AAN8JL63_PATCE
MFYLLKTWNSLLERKVDNRNFILRNNFFNGTPQPGTKICCVIEGRTKNSIKPEAVVFLSDTAITATTTSRRPPTRRRPTTTRRPTRTKRPTTVKPAPMPPASSGNTPNYAEVLGKSILFYEAQRSGVLPKDNRVKWRGDSAVHDQGLRGEDLSGGWYDAADYVKFNLPMASATTMLLWGLYTFKDAYTLTNELDNMYKSVKWPLDYFLKCWNPKTQEYYYQVGSGKLDHNYWGRPEDMHMRRPAMKVDRHTPGSDVAGETATSLALGSIVFRQKDRAYSDKLLLAAKSLYKFAKEVPGKYPLKDYYDSSGYKDELCTAAIWLYRATKDSNYLKDADLYYTDELAWAQDWDDKIIACQMLMYEEKRTRRHAQVVKDFFTSWRPGGDVPYTPGGLAYRNKWGSLRYDANTAFLALIAAEDGLMVDDNRKWAAGQINYMLGKNKENFSYVIGYTNNYPLHPHHASSSCPNPPATCDWDVFDSTKPNTHILYGALVGGPNTHDHYIDKRDEYEYSEVTCDYNAGFQSAIAGLIKLQHDNKLPPIVG